MGVDAKTFQELNDRVDLLKYASQTIELEQRGSDWWGRCPLHVDNTPSFSITPSKNYYYCFSCGCHGGIVKFLMDFEHLTYPQAVRKAAKLAEMDSSEFCKSNAYSFMVKTKQMMKKKSAVEHQILDESVFDDPRYKMDAAEEWVKEGISPEVQALFGVRIEYRANRIVYPVYDNKGNLINIKGRTRYSNYKDLKVAKYISYYPIGTMDYLQGINITLPYIKEKKEVIIFESIKSVMKAFEWGYRNAVSAEKHSLTDEQVKILLGLGVNIVFAYDSDIDYGEGKQKKDIDKMKMFTNVFIISDDDNLLGGKDAKNSPVDVSREVWETLYKKKRKMV